MSKVKILLLRRWYMVGGAALLAAAAIFYAVNYPASVSAAATTRQLPIYSVERSQKVCAISFDAAWGDAIVRQFSRPNDGRSIIKGSKNHYIESKMEAFHFQIAIFLRFMAAYLSLTQAETRARPRWCV